MNARAQTNGYAHENEKRKIVSHLDARKIRPRILPTLNGIVGSIEKMKEFLVL